MTLFDTVCRVEFEIGHKIGDLVEIALHDAMDATSYL
jgi:hypothetical protein